MKYAISSSSVIMNSSRSSLPRRSKSDGISSTNLLINELVFSDYLEDLGLGNEKKVDKEDKEEIESTRILKKPLTREERKKYNERRRKRDLERARSEGYSRYFEYYWRNHEEISARRRENRIKNERREKKEKKEKKRREKKEEKFDLLTEVVKEELIDEDKNSSTSSLNPIPSLTQELKMSIDFLTDCASEFHIIVKSKEWQVQAMETTIKLHRSRQGFKEEMIDEFLFVSYDIGT